MLDQSRLQHAAQLDALRKFARFVDVLAEKSAKRAVGKNKDSR